MYLQVKLKKFSKNFLKLTFLNLPYRIFVRQYSPYISQIVQVD